MDVLQQMRVVLAVSEQGSLTAAARHLGTSLPTVVRVLADAERRLSVRFFDRTTRRIHITEEGSIYADTCRRLLAEIDEVEDVLRERRVKPQGTLAITAPNQFGSMHVAPVVSDFLRSHPGVNVNLMLLDRVVDLVEEGIDVAVRIGPVADLDLIAVPVGQVRRCVCAAPALMKQLPRVVSPQMLGELPFIQNLGLMPKPELRLPSRTKRPPLSITNVRLVTNNGAAAIAACRSGLGAAVFLSYQVHELIRSGALKLVDSDLAFDPEPVSILYAPARRVSARTRVFVSWAKKALATRVAAVD
jgi:DNA-binding transcriptional LysR family regulator